MRILLVEDDELLGDGTRSGLEQNGIAVDWVQLGGEADAALRIHAYDVVILDIGLPDQSGLDLLKALGKSEAVCRNTGDDEEDEHRDGRGEAELLNIRAERQPVREGDQQVGLAPFNRRPWEWSTLGQKVYQGEVVEVEGERRDQQW